MSTKRSSDNDEYICGKCQAKFVQLLAFLLHKVEHVECGKPGSCQLCGMAFSRQVTLREHLFRKHCIRDVKPDKHNGKHRGRVHKPTFPADDTVCKNSSDVGNVQLVVKLDVSPTRNKIGSSDATPNEASEQSEAMDEGIRLESCICTSSVESRQEVMQVTVDRLVEGEHSSHSPAAVRLSDSSGPPSHLTPVTPSALEATSSESVSSATSTTSATSTLSLVTTTSTLITSIMTPAATEISGSSVPTGQCFISSHPSDGYVDGGAETRRQSPGAANYPNSDDSAKETGVSPPFKPSSCVSSNINVNHGESCVCSSLQSSSQQPEGELHTGSQENHCTGLPSSSDLCIEQTNPTGQDSSLIISKMKEDKEEEPDFLFVLLTSQVKGKAASSVKQSFRCFHCHYLTSQRRSLVKHMVDSHSDQLPIHQCISVLKAESSGGHHHSQNQQVIKMSDYNTVLARQRHQSGKKKIRYVEKQDLPGYYPCSQCDKVFGRLRYLRKHSALHKTDEKHLCPDCGKSFKAKAYLTAHRQTHQTKVYQCSQCDFSSSINTLIHTHRQQHKGSSVICDICGQAYNDRQTLKKHQLVHDKSRPFPCSFPGCTWRFKTEIMCRAHYRNHTTTGKFVCHLCSYVFRHKHHLQRHLSKIHGMDEASIFQATCGNRPVQVESYTVVEEVVAIDQEKQLVEVVHEELHPLADTVSLIVNSGISTEQLQSVLENGHYIIATDDSSIIGGSYKVANITYSSGFDGSQPGTSESQTVLIPDTQCSQIIFQ